MAVEFLKRQFKFFIGLLCGLIFTFLGVYSVQISAMKQTTINERFYFLVSSSNLSVEAAVQVAYVNGGAGYLLKDDNKEFAVYHCYFRLANATRAQEELSQRGIDCCVYERSVDKMCYKTKRQKQTAGAVEGYLNVLKGGYLTLFHLAKGAENGDFSQESLRECIGVVCTALEGVKGNEFSLKSPRIKAAFAVLEQQKHGLIYSKDLRYVAVALCDEYLKVSTHFSL